MVGKNYSEDEIMQDIYDNAKERLVDVDIFDLKEAMNYMKKLRKYGKFIRNNIDKLKRES